MTTFTSAAAAVEAQQARQDHLEELYDHDGRHEPSHPMHGLYTGLVQHTPTTPKGDSMSKFVVFSLSKQPIALQITIRKSSIHAFYPDSLGNGTVIEYTSESAIVKESFDEVCAIMGVTVTPSQQEES